MSRPLMLICGLILFFWGGIGFWSIFVPTIGAVVISGFTLMVGAVGMMLSDFNTRIRDWVDHK